MKDDASLSTLGYAVLGLLARAALSGYDLIRLLEEPVGFFWRARRSQIYPELARLHAAGLITFEVVVQSDRPDKKVYSITEAGLSALRSWAAAPMAVPADRDEFMLKVYSLWLADPEQAVALVRAHEEHHASRLTRYLQIEQQMLRNRGSEAKRIDSPVFSAYATLRRGIEYERGYVSWCRWMIASLQGNPALDHD